MSARSCTADIQLRLEGFSLFQNDAGFVSSVRTGGWVLRDYFTDGVEANQASRAWEYEDAITSGNTTDIDLYDLAGLDSGAGAGADALGQALAVEEIVCLVVNHVSGGGYLEIMPTNPSNPLAWLPSMTVVKGNALQAGGSAMFYQPDADSFDVADGSSHNVRLGANGGDVTYHLYLLGKHDDEASSSSSSSKSTSCTTLSTSSTQSESTLSTSSTQSTLSSSTLSLSTASSSSTSQSSSTLSSSSTAMLSSTSVSVSLSSSPSTVTLGSELQVFGIDYGITSDPTELEWLANNSDATITYQEAPLLAKQYNANLRVYGYLGCGQVFDSGQATVPTDQQTWLSNWCTGQGLDPEDCYIHYLDDYEFQPRTGDPITIPGYPNGSAATRAESRAMGSYWSGAYPMMAFHSNTAKLAITALIQEHMDQREAATGYVYDGMMLDSFGDWHYANQDLTLTEEFHGMTAAEATAAAYGAQSSFITTAQVSLGISLLPNMSSDDWYYRQPNTYDEALIELLYSNAYYAYTRSGTPTIDFIDGIGRILEESLSGTIFYLHTVTGSATKPVAVSTQEAWDWFIQGCLASVLLLWNENIKFGFFEGSYSYYGGTKESHRLAYAKASIGSPIVSGNNDILGNAGTDHCYFLENNSPLGPAVLARQFENGFVCCQWADTSGWANIGGGSGHVVTLPRRMHRIQPDGTLGDGITSVTLYNGQGAVCVG